MPDDCIDHGKRGTGKGYAQRSVNGRLRYLHRLAYAEAHGLIENQIAAVIRHVCDNPRCVNPRHLVMGTYLQNTEDMLSRGRCNPPRGERSGSVKLTAQQVAEIRASSCKQSDLAAIYGITQSQVSRIKGGKQWQQS